MLGSVHENEHCRLIEQPEEIGAAETQTPYVMVSHDWRLGTYNPWTVPESSGRMEVLCAMNPSG